MKKLFLILSLLSIFQSCSTFKTPEFKGVSRVDIKKKQSGKVVLVAYAQFHNPNLLGGKFKLNELKVFVNDNFFATLNSDTYKVPVLKDFEIPLEVDFDKNFFNKKNILNTINNVFQKSMNIQYKGKIYYVSKTMGKIPYNIDYTQKINPFE